jgi:hypothetical protein
VFATTFVFEDEVVSLLSAWSQMRGSALVGSSLALKYKIREEVNGACNTLAYYEKATIVAINRIIVRSTHSGG